MFTQAIAEGLQVIGPKNARVFRNLVKIKGDLKLTDLMSNHGKRLPGDGPRIVVHRIGRTGLHMSLTINQRKGPTHVVSATSGAACHPTIVSHSRFRIPKQRIGAGSIKVAAVEGSESFDELRHHRA